jgi:RNA polymerase sigma-70 factor (ECF subfamily)
MNHAESRASGEASSGTSHSLLERAKANDGEAWDRLVGLYGPLVYQWCGRWDLQESDRADVMQQVFQSVASHIGRFRKERPGDSFRGWLRTITRNKVVDHIRRQGREPPGEGGTTACFRWSQLPEAPVVDGTESDEGKSGDDAPEVRELFFRALDLIQAEFEPRTWKAFWMAAVDDRPAKDVAEALSMSPGAVRVAKSRVLQRLREELGDLGD